MWQYTSIIQLFRWLTHILLSSTLATQIWPQQTKSICNRVSLQHHPNKELNSYHSTCWPPAVVSCGFNVWSCWQLAPKLPKSHLLYKASDRFAWRRFHLLCSIKILHQFMTTDSSDSVRNCNVVKLSTFTFTSVCYRLKYTLQAMSSVTSTLQVTTTAQLQEFGTVISQPTKSTMYELAPQ
jgi:hypothetical protein